MHPILTLLDLRSDENNSIIARGVLAIVTMLGSLKFSPKLVIEWVQYGTVIVTFLVGVVTLISICLSFLMKWRKWKAGRAESSSSGDVLKIILFLSLFSFNACSLLPSEREQSQSLKATEALLAQHDLTIKRATEREQGIVVTRDGQVVAVPIRETLEISSKSSTDAGTKTNANGTFSQTIPLGVKLTLIGIGIIAIVFGLSFAWKRLKVTAIGQGISLADDVLAGQIRKIRNRAQTSTDPSEIARLNADIADLESERGRTIARSR